LKDKVIDGISYKCDISHKLLRQLKRSEIRLNDETVKIQSVHDFEVDQIGSSQSSELSDSANQNIEIQTISVDSQFVYSSPYDWKYPGFYYPAIACPPMVFHLPERSDIENSASIFRSGTSESGQSMHDSHEHRNRVTHPSAPLVIDQNDSIPMDLHHQGSEGNEFCGRNFPYAIWGNQQSPPGNFVPFNFPQQLWLPRNNYIGIPSIQNPLMYHDMPPIVFPFNSQFPFPGSIQCPLNSPFQSPLMYPLNYTSLNPSISSLRDQRNRH
jgi:hypothetical protein